MERIIFEEKGHSYHNSKGEKYTSVTTLLHNYIEEFDEDYWSDYKAIERLYKKKRGQNAFTDLKRKIGYKNIISSVKPFLEGENLQLFIKFKKDILIEWKEERVRACDKGSAYHDTKEKEDIERGFSFVGDITLPVISNNGYKKEGNYFIENRDLTNLEAGVYPEMLIYLPEYLVCGLSDKVILYPNKQFRIRDYKTNKKIVYTSFKEKKMKFPLDCLMDCNYYHYEMQLSIYAYMLEQYGYKCIGLTLDYYEVPIELKYRRSLVASLLMHHKNNNMKHDFILN